LSSRGRALGLSFLSGFPVNGMRNA
jgi:hypothetical protein